MVILSAAGLTKSFVLQTVLKDASFSVNEGDKIGILGVNGAGKTTLFKLISKEEQPDEGEIYLSSDTRVAYMRQHSDYTSEKTARQEVLEVFSPDLSSLKRSSLKRKSFWKRIILKRQ